MPNYRRNSGVGELLSEQSIMALLSGPFQHQTKAHPFAPQFAAKTA